jgi:uncharacterized protein (TIGR03067 family)
MSHCLRFALALMVFIGFGVARGADEASDLARRLQGEWEGVEIEIQGEKRPEEDAKAFRLSIKGDEVTVKTNSCPGRKSKLEKLDPAKSPMEMDLLALERSEKGGTQHCIISLDKERLLLCAPLSGDRRPTEFKTQAKDGFVLVLLKRVESKRLGPRPGIYGGSYVYLGSDWKWHEIRGRIICVWPNGGISTE